MPRLKDIPVGTLTPDEEEALANDTFDYADKERVSLREASRVIREDQKAKNQRASLAEVRKAFGEDVEPRPISPYPYNITEGYGDFTFREKAAEIGKAVHRGLGAVIKIPGVGLKLLGELEPTRKEISERKKESTMYDPRQQDYFESTIGRAERKTMDSLRRAGNWYIGKINGLMMPESPESRAQRNRAFIEAPFYRTATAVGESAPSYAVAVAATVSTGNPNIGLWVLGTTTAAASYDNLRSMGVEPDLALIGAATEGSIEMLTEKIPMDMLMRGSARPLLVRALKIGTAESFQELFAQLGQNYVNAVIQDVDPDNLSSITKAAQQEWSIISEGWQDAMAAGFVMGGGAATIVSGPNKGRTPAEMQQQYGFMPRNMNEFIALTETIKDQVRQVEPFEGVLEQAQAAGAGISITERLAQLQADADATKAARVQVMVEGGLSEEKATEVFENMRELENQQVLTQVVPEVKPEAAAYVESIEKGISQVRVEQLTGTKLPSAAEIRRSFDKMDRIEQVGVVENVKAELQELQDDKKSLLQQRKEAFVPDKPFFTQKIKDIGKRITGKQAQLERFEQSLKPTILLVEQELFAQNRIRPKGKGIGKGRF